MHKPQQICVRCVMDTTDPEIVFDADGVCSHCHAYEAQGRPIVERARTEEGRKVLETVVAQIKASGQGRDYDCVLGISGGVDSSYAACMAKELGLRPLAVHFDSGWNSELAVNNVENIVKTLDFDLYTYVCDWEEMRDLQLAFFRASLANCDVPQDHAFFAVLHQTARTHGIKYIISGGNAATEFILPTSWGYNAGDLTHLLAVQKRFGTMKLKRYPTLSFAKRYFIYPYMLGIRTVRLLDLLPYDKAQAKAYITEKVRWRDYGGKHYESIFTRFFQAYYLPVKFNFDKRKAHCSSLIASGQMSREQALEELRQPPYPTDQLASDKAFVAKKLGVSEEEFDMVIAQPPRSYQDFPSSEWLFRLKDRMMRSLRERNARR